VIAPSSAQAAQPSPSPALQPHDRLAEAMKRKAEEKDSRLAMKTRSMSAVSAVNPGIASQVTSSIPSEALSPVPVMPMGSKVEPVPTDGVVAETAKMQQMASAATKAIQEGNIVSAREILERSVAAGDKFALLALAETYDPNVLSAMQINRLQGDPQRARELYRKAAKAGIREARRRIARLPAKNVRQN
jgi:flagellar motor protein MotB